MASIWSSARAATSSEPIDGPCRRGRLRCRLLRSTCSSGTSGSTRWDTGLDFGLEFEGYFNEQSFDDPKLGPASSTIEQFSHGGFLVNGVLTWPYSEEFSFYGGGGIGLATAIDIDSKSDAASSFSVEDESSFVYQGKVGARFNMGEDLSWFLQYRRLTSPDVTVGDTFIGPATNVDIDIEQNIFEVGVRWNY